jgi:2'-5' RNA ligase
MGDDAAAPPLLVTLALDRESFARLDALRTRLFPPERNVVPAHISLFHRLPGDERAAVEATLTSSAGESRPMTLRFGGVSRLGAGVAAQVEAPGLGAIHARLARAFAPWLTPQDRQPFRPHVTLMNKATRDAAALAHAGLREAWEPWEGVGEGLLLWSYLGGPWRFEARFAFGGDSGRTGTRLEGEEARRDG